MGSEACGEAAEGGPEQGFLMGGQRGYGGLWTNTAWAEGGSGRGARAECLWGLPLVVSLNFYLRQAQARSRWLRLTSPTDHPTPEAAVPWSPRLCLFVPGLGVGGHGYANESWPRTWGEGGWWGRNGGQGSPPPHNRSCILWGGKLWVYFPDEMGCWEALALLE